MSAKKETVLFETGNVVLKVVTTYDLRVRAGSKLEVPIPGLGETVTVEQPPTDDTPTPHDVLHTLTIMNVRSADSVTVELDSAELEDLNRSIEKAMTKTRSRYQL